CGGRQALEPVALGAKLVARKLHQQGCELLLGISLSRPLVERFDALQHDLRARRIPLTSEVADGGAAHLARNPGPGEQDLVDRLAARHPCYVLRLQPVEEEDDPLVITSREGPSAEEGRLPLLFESRKR